MESKKSSEKASEGASLPVSPSEAGVQKPLKRLDSCSPLSWGQVYPCKSRGRNDKNGLMRTFSATSF